MNKYDVINSISAAMPKLPKSDIEAVVNKTIEIISESLVSGEPVRFSDFGSFYIGHRRARIYKSPAGLERIFPEKKVPCFRAGKRLKEMVEDSG